MTNFHAELETFNFIAIMQFPSEIIQVMKPSTLRAENNDVAYVLLPHVQVAGANALVHVSHSGA